ncbi:arogenate dehydratase/prephenate dehydratase 2, chloroplastic-like protein [Tanacetum coccineum]
MATTGMTSRTPINPPSSHPSNSNHQFPSSSSKLKFTLNHKLRRFTINSSSSIQRSSTSDGSTTSKNTSLPRPLTSTDLTGLPSEGSRLMRVAYQGVPGAYSESAAEKAYPNCEAVPCEQFETAFEAVERWLVDRAVLPIENSLGGSIHRNYDLLLRHRLHIVGEVKLSIRHCLLANHGVKVEDLKRVLSHPQALAQCENTLTRLGIVREAVDDTAGAAKHVALHELKDTGAVASAAAAKIYGLNLLVQDIQDYSDNVTRFLMLAREPIIPRTDRPFKTSIVFSLDEGPGMLFKALAVFAMRQLNLTKAGSLSFPYLFYVDFQASMADQRAQNALSHLKEVTLKMSPYETSQELCFECSDKDYELNLSMYGKAAKLEKQMDAKLAWLLKKYYYRSQTHIGCSSSQADLYLTEKKLHQLHLDEEALRETLKEKAIDEKAREEKIKQKQAEDDEFFLEFRTVRYDSEYESSD